jgi:hypothetical protein
MKTFIFEIPIEAEEYTSETCKRDYGSKDNYNADFPEHVYASMNHIDQLFKDAETFCYFSMMNLLEKGKGYPSNLDTIDKRLYNTYKKRAKYYQELRKKVKCSGIQA